jgi:hypothetical protein
MLTSDNDTIVVVVNVMAFLGTCDLESIFAIHVENGRPPSRANYEMSVMQNIVFDKVNPRPKSACCC